MQGLRQRDECGAVSSETHTIATRQCGPSKTHGYDARSDTGQIERVGNIFASYERY